jgi:hypothetical protein
MKNMKTNEIREANRIKWAKRVNRWNKWKAEQAAAKAEEMILEQSRERELDKRN